MKTNKILTRENQTATEITDSVEKIFKGLKLEYSEVYYLDYEVDEDTGMINREKKVEHYTKGQIERNMRALKNAFYVAKGAAAPSEIISFRKRYRIPASTFSIVLGFSKNTISNIEKDGITSLTTGRLIKMCLNNIYIVYQYIQLCDAIDSDKKDELSKRLLGKGV